MNKKLEEAKDCLKEIIQNTYAEGKATKLNYLLNYIDNSISKEVILDKIRERQFELQQEYIDFKDDIRLNTLQELLEEK